MINGKFVLIFFMDLTSTKAFVYDPWKFILGDLFFNKIILNYFKVFRENYYLSSLERS